VAGPCGQFLYQGKGKIQALNREKELILEGVFSNIGFIAGGCGITAPFQLIKYLTEVEKDEKMGLKLLFANRSKADILLREELDDLQKKNPNLEIHYILSEVFFYLNAEYYLKTQKEKDWSGMTGLINEEVLRSVFGKEINDETLITFCGNPEFNELMKKNLGKIGFKEEQLLSWYGL
jgi:cytochrome-b5 reductase